MFNKMKALSFMMCAAMASCCVSSLNTYAAEENPNAYDIGNYRMYYSVKTDGENEYISIDSYWLTSFEFPAVYPIILMTPSEIDGLPVMEIGDNAFNNEEITFPAHRLTIASAKTIGESAFSGCWRLSEVDFPDGLETIGKNAFYGCEHLTEVSIPKSVTTIEDKALGYIEGRVYVPAGSGFVDYGCKMPMSEFVIYGYKGTEAERYALDNGFIFESIDPSGDINGDNEINMKDVLSLQKYITGNKKFSKGEAARADICNDGRINCFDISEMKSFIIEIKNPQIICY